MNKVNRNTFLRMTALAALAPLGNRIFAATTGSDLWTSDELFKKMVVANDSEVATLLQTINYDELKFSRRIGNNYTALVASYCCSQSKYYHSELIIPKLDILNRFLSSHQSEDGTVNIANLESPPDTAFLLEYLTAAAAIMVKDNSFALSNTNAALKRFILKAGDALTTGGVHTPNHRWVICAALARLNAVYPDKKYVNRIEDWLGEGIFMDSDGEYPERSRIYSNVENNSLITIGRLLNKPSLFKYAQKNLETTYFFMQPNGDLVTNSSRRQDQYEPVNMVIYYLHYRYLAIRDNNSYFAGIAKVIEGMKGFDKEVLQKDLFHFLENSLLQKELPVATTPPINYEKYLPATKILRIRRGDQSTTLFGGVDWPLIIASGRSDSPDFYSYRKGNAILKYLRLSTNFFGMGYFYSEGIKKEGGKYILHKKLNIPYYQPLPANLRKKNGDYKLSPSIDDRFWNKMDFSNRPVSNVKTLDTTITFSENKEGNELDFQITGLKGVQVTIEFCFSEGGVLSGVTQNTDGNYFLESGIGKYEFGNDSILFGQGFAAHKIIRNLEGERYSTHFGTLRTEGMHVYITGVTPFSHKLTFS